MSNELILNNFQSNVDNDGMKLDEMDLLVRVAETGSMTRAAQHLHLTPAAVSATVRRMEEVMGVRLFERTTRSVHPTEEGLVVLEGCRDVLDRWSQTLEEAKGPGTEVVGTVHLSAPADTTYEVLAPVLVKVSKEQPQLQVVVHSSDSLLHLHKDAIDMAIRYGPLKDSTLEARTLAECPGILVASPAYIRKEGNPRGAKDLAKHRCLTLRLSGAAVTSWTLLGNGSTQEVALRSSLCGDGYLVRGWAIEGLGIARKSIFDVIEDLEAGRLVRVLPELHSGSSAIQAVFPSRRFLPARVRLIDMAISAAFTDRARRCEEWLSTSENRNVDKKGASTRKG